MHGQNHIKDGQYCEDDKRACAMFLSQ